MYNLVNYFTLLTVAISCAIFAQNAIQVNINELKYVEE
jgi:hypothetical protein